MKCRTAGAVSRRTYGTTTAWAQPARGRWAQANPNSRRTTGRIPNLRPRGSAHKADVKATTLFTLYYHWMRAPAQIPSQFTPPRGSRLSEAFYR
ncbi:hypothetical protein EVAR_36876_1 [Eumeta japonica]|uniref:Uncharacterized protein n=1 Tax=Eumeta variegata TaxID=151549 RepID=A0A4C1WSP7_EUMVA|nr:hypothetical protein EVAR_36876_1 [Eumeta japonica]